MADEWDAREAGTALLVAVTRAITSERAKAAGEGRVPADADLARAVLRSAALRDANRRLLDDMMPEYEQKVAAMIAAEAAPLIEAAVAGQRSALASADNAIGQVLRHAWSWQEAGGILEARHVAAILLDVLDEWTGKGRSDEEEAASPLAAELEGQLALPGTETRPWPYDGPHGRARLTGSLDTGGSFTGDDDDPEGEPS